VAIHTVADQTKALLLLDIWCTHLLLGLPCDSNPELNASRRAINGALALPEWNIFYFVTPVPSGSAASTARVNRKRTGARSRVAHSRQGKERRRAGVAVHQPRPPHWEGGRGWAGGGHPAERGPAPAKIPKLRNTWLLTSGNRLAACAGYLRPILRIGRFRSIAL